MTVARILAALASLIFFASPALADPPLPPEACFASPACRADADGNGTITVTDFAQFLAVYGKSWAAACMADPVCRFDFDGNGIVTPADFGAMLAERDAQN